MDVRRLCLLNAQLYPRRAAFRVVYVLEYPIHSAAEYREAYQAVAWWMLGDGAMTDPACKDPLRLYYGSPRGDVRPNWSVLARRRSIMFPLNTAPPIPLPPRRAKWPMCPLPLTKSE